jgi:class 3 adenylate cyclase/predicted ATPase
MGCGAILVSGVICAHCQTLLPAQAAFCYHCGTYLAQNASFALPASQPAAALPHSPAPQRVETPAAAAQGDTTPQPAEPESAPSSPPAETGSAIHQVGKLPAARPLQELRPSLVHYLPEDLFAPLERRPKESDLTAVAAHLADLLQTVKTYLPAPVVLAPQPPGEPRGGMVRGVFLFGDVSGFTPLSEKLKALGQEGAEIMTRLINRLFTDLVTVLFDHGGTLLKFGGDAMLGLFPAETDQQMSEGAQRAAQAAILMQQVLQKEEFAQIDALGEKRALQIKVGISAGPFFAAHIGTQPRPELNLRGTMAYVTTGKTVNEAEEAEGHANPGEIAMTSRVADLLGSSAEMGPVNKNPDAHFLRLIAISPMQAGSTARLEVQEPPQGETLAKITYLVERLDRLTRYLSTELISRIITNPRGARITPENRPVTVMFANYRGISRLIEKLGESDPELITQHLNRYFVHMAGIVEKYQGTLARMDQYAVGDRLVIFFGAPRAHEDDPIRAVQTALEMQEAVTKNFSALRTPTGVYQFEQRIGINTGFLFAGNAGAPDLRQEYTLMGDDINMAARLMSNAPWNDIFISKRTKDYVDENFALEDKGALKVKGKEILIPTFKVIGALSGYQEGQNEPDAAPLTGRDELLSRLQKSTKTLLNSRRGQVISLVGNSGFGKSRLAHEVKKWLFSPEIASQENSLPLWIEARALSFSEQMSFWLATQIMLGVLQPKPGASGDQILYQLSERCEQLLSEDSMEATPYLAHMMGLDLGQEWSWVKDLDPKVRQKQTLWAAAAFFEAAAKERPMIVVLDDLHWADEASLGLIEHLLSVTDKSPLLFILIFRARRDKRCWQLRDFAASEYPHRYQEIVLQPLDLENSTLLLSRLLPEAQFDPETRHEILDKAAGNPLYLQEVVHSLKDSGAVKENPERPGEWLVTQGITQIKVPDTLQAAIVARIDRLTEDTRQALQMAAVIGRQFRLKLFQNLAQAEDEISYWISQLERGGLIQPAESSDDPLYDFPDALVQEVAYDSLLVQRKQDYHARIGKMIEEQNARDAVRLEQDVEKLSQQNCELLAYHFSRSSQPEQALPYLEMAARKSIDRYANETAIEYYEQILEIQRRRKSPDGTKGQFKALYTMGVIAYEIGEYDRARPHLQEAARVCQEIDDPANEGWSVMYLGMVDLKQANYDQATLHHQHAIALAQGREDRMQEGIHLTNLARVTMRLGQYDLALEQFDRSLEMKRQTRDLPGQGFALFYQAMIYIYQERFDQAETALQEAHRVWNVGDPLSASSEAWKQTPRTARLISYYHYGQGLLALGRGQFVRAAEELEKALEICNRLVLKAEIIENLSALSQAQAGNNQLQDAAGLSNQAVKLLITQKDVEEVQQVYFNHSQILQALGDPAAPGYLQKAQQVVEARASRISEPLQRQVYLEQVRVNRLIAQALQATQNN